MEIKGNDEARKWKSVQDLLKYMKKSGIVVNYKIKELN